MLRLFFIASFSLVLIGCEMLSGINTSQFEPSTRGVANGVPLGSRHLKDLQKDGVVLADSREGTVIILPADRIFYQITDRVIINPDYQTVLNDLVHILKGYPTVKFQVIGHTDGVMTPSLQDKQSSDFAYVIANYLTAAGISPARITFVRGVADRQPIDRRNNGTARELNRRVEIITEAPIR
jgi:outer membrane protein OmpA-like peptidoglycan-associated protein